jgi:hypothetical protein
LSLKCVFSRYAQVIALVWDWLRHKKSTKKQIEEEEEKDHPFDRAPREINDALSRYRDTTESLAAVEEKRLTREALKRVKS